MTFLMLSDDQARRAKADGVTPRLKEEYLANARLALDHTVEFYSCAIHSRHYWQTTHNGTQGQGLANTFRIHLGDKLVDTWDDADRFLAGRAQDLGLKQPYHYLNLSKSQHSQFFPAYNQTAGTDTFSSREYQRPCR